MLNVTCICILIAQNQVYNELDKSNECLKVKK